MVRWFVRVLAGLVAVVALAAVAGGISFSLWKGDLERRLAAGSEIVSTSRGDIEVAVAGEGAPFLSLHGNPGGYDQGLVARRLERAEGGVGLQTITVSRPGYLRTPLSSGETFKAQADLFAALLDELGIDRVVVYGASGGGYPALQFALRHPDRCLGLILYAPSVSYEPVPEDFAPYSGGWSASEIIAWALGGPLIHVLGPAVMPELDTSDPLERDLARAMMQSALAPAAARAEGVRNDTLQRDDPAIDDWPLERIAAPTLILHGDADENSIYEGSVRVAAKIPDARLVTFEGGDHYIGITRAEEVRDHIARFVSEIAP